MKVVHMSFSWVCVLTVICPESSYKELTFVRFRFKNISRGYI